MQFLNGARLEEFINKDVHLILTSNASVCETLPICFAFLRDGKLCVDLIPNLDKKYVVEVPENSILSVNELDLSMGRYGIIIPAESKSGSVILNLLDQKRRYQQDST